MEVLTTLQRFPEMCRPSLKKNCMHCPVKQTYPNGLPLQTWIEENSVVEVFEHEARFCKFLIQRLPSLINFFQQIFLTRQLNFLHA